MRSVIDPQEARKILPPALLQAALDGVRDGLQSGELTGWPLVDVAVTLTNVERREGLTTIPGCHMAAGQALREALSKAAPVALEPVMRVEINVPEDFLGPAISLFTAAGGKVEDLEDHAGRKLLRGTAPLRRLFGFSTSLRSATQGRAGLMLAFDRFDQFNLRLGRKIVADMSHLGSLIGNRLDPLGVGISEGIDGDACQEIEVFVTVNIPDVGTLAVIHDAQRRTEHIHVDLRVLSQPLAVLRT